MHQIKHFHTPSSFNCLIYIKFSFTPHIPISCQCFFSRAQSILSFDRGWKSHRKLCMISFTKQWQFMDASHEHLSCSAQRLKIGESKRKYLIFSSGKTKLTVTLGPTRTSSLTGEHNYEPWLTAPTGPHFFCFHNTVICNTEH